MMKKRSTLKSWSLAIPFSVVLATLFAKQIWKVGVRMVRAMAHWNQGLPPGSLPGEAKRKEKSSKGSVVSSHGECSVVVAAPITASSSSSSSSSSSLAQLPQVSLQKSAPRPKGVPRVKRSSKMGHQPSVTPSPKAQPQGSSMPSVEEDIFERWDETEREEPQIRIEMNRAKPGIDQLPDDEFPDLPFQVFSTRFGGVYHLNRSCRHLASVNTGPSRESKWHSRCRRSAYQNGSLPALGATFYLRGYGCEAHSDMRCATAFGANHLPICTACLEATK